MKPLYDFVAHEIMDGIIISKTEKSGTSNSFDLNYSFILPKNLRYVCKASIKTHPTCRLNKKLREFKKKRDWIKMS